MNIERALNILKENGILVEKMSDEEKAAKRKARRDAKKAEEARMKDPTYAIGKYIERDTEGTCAYLTLSEVQQLTDDYDVQFKQDDYGTLYIEYKGVKIAERDYRSNKREGWVVPDAYTFKIEHYDDRARIISREWNTEDGDNNMTDVTDPELNYKDLYRWLSRTIPRIDQLIEEMNRKSTDDDPYLSPSEVREWDRDELEEFGEKLKAYARDLGFIIEKERNGFDMIYDVRGLYRSSVMSYSIYSDRFGCFWNHPHWAGLGKFGQTYTSQLSISIINLPYLKKFIKEYKEFLDKYFEILPFSQIKPSDDVLLFISGYRPISAIAIKRTKIADVRDNPLVNLEDDLQPDLSGYSDDDDCLIVRLTRVGSANGKLVVVGNQDCIEFKNTVKFD
jgi:hypothetical protein